MVGLDQTASVYTPDSAGAYTVLAKSGLRCRLAPVSIPSAAVGGGRAEIADETRLLWEPGYVLAETAQIEVAGVRWNTVAGTFDAIRGPASSVIYRRCQVERVA